MYPCLDCRISIRGLWQPQTVALLDVQVVDTDAPSCIQWSTFPQQKRRKGNTAVQLKYLLHLLLYPLMECWAERQIGLPKGLDKPLAYMMAAHKVLFLEIQRATNLCLCIKWRSGVGIVDGAEYYQDLINTFIYFIISFYLLYNNNYYSRVSIITLNIYNIITVLSYTMLLHKTIHWNGEGEATNIQLPSNETAELWHSL